MIGECVVAMIGGGRILALAAVDDAGGALAISGWRMLPACAGDDHGAAAMIRVPSTSGCLR
jgi:hypothetical protein